MNKNKVLFKIKNHELYNDIKLIDLDVPLLFVCIDESKNRYLVLCVDPDECYYLVVPITSDKLIHMLNGQISMRNPFETSDVVYSIITAPDYNNDSITEKSPKEIDDEDLPRENAYFNLKLHEELNSYISDLQSNFKINGNLELILPDEWIINESLDLSLKEYLIDLKFSDLDCQKVNRYCNKSLKEYSIYYDSKSSTLGYPKIDKNFNVIYEYYSMHNNDSFQADFDLNNLVCCDESEDGSYCSVINDNTMSAA